MIIFCGCCWFFGAQKPVQYLQPVHLQHLALANGIFYFYLSCQILTVPPLKNLNVKMIMRPAYKNDEPSGGDDINPMGLHSDTVLNPGF